MNLFVVAAIAAVLVVLRLRKAPLIAWAIAIWIGFYLALRFGFTVPIPASVIAMYMGIATLALTTYVTSDAGRRRAVVEPLTRLMTERRYLPLLAVLVVALPIVVAVSVYLRMNTPIEPPFFARTIHPANPASIT